MYSVPINKGCAEKGRPWRTGKVIEQVRGLAFGRQKLSNLASSNPLEEPPWPKWRQLGNNGCHSYCVFCTRREQNLVEYNASADKKGATEAEAEACELQRRLMKSDDKSDELKDRTADLERSVQKHTYQLRESDSKLLDLHKTMESQAVEMTTWEAKANKLDNEFRNANSSCRGAPACCHACSRRRNY